MPIVADAAVAIRGDLSKFSGDLDKAEKQTQTLGGKLKNALSPGNLAAGLAGGFAVSQIGQFLGDAIGSASALNESVAKVNVVFGKSSDSVKEWAKGMASSFGISNQAALEAAGTYGNLFQAFGLGQEEATKMSTTLVELAADLASFNNTSVEDALLALRSGLSGETEPLKRYGIAISEARMRTELLAMGVSDLGATLTPLQKTQAAYALILKDSTLAQGDSARSADNLAMQQKFLDAAMQDLSAEIGNVLLPVMVELVKFARKDLIPALRAVGDAVGFMIDRITDVKNAPGAAKDWLASLLGIEPDTFQRLEDRVAQGTHHLFGTVTEQVEVDAENLSRQAANVLTSAAGAVGDAAKVGITDPITQATREAREKAAEEVRAIPGDLAVALIEGRDEVVIAAAVLAKAGTDPLIEKAKLLEIREHMKELSHITLEEREKATPATIAADRAMYAALEIELAGHLLRQDPTSKEAAQLLAKYATSEEPATKAAYDSLMSEIEQRAYIMANDIEAEAERAGISPEEAFKRHKEAAAEQALGLARGLIKALDMESDAGVAGTGAVNAWVNAMIAAFGANVTRTAAAVGAYSKMLKMAGSPDYYHALEAGLGVGKAWVGGVVDALHSGLGDVTAALPTLGANGGLPSMTSMTLGATSAVASGSTIGDTNININAPTVPMTERDIGRELRRTGVFGVTP